VRQAAAARSRNAGRSDSRVDLRPRMLVACLIAGIVCRVTAVATHQLPVGAGAAGYERGAFPADSARPQITTLSAGPQAVEHVYMFGS
jgi:hypothetical protein